MDIMRKMFYFGIGAITVTKEKAEKMINEMVEKGEMNKDEAKQFVDEVLKKGEEEKNELRNIIRKEINKFKDDVGIITRSDIERLEKRINDLENRLS